MNHIPALEAEALIAALLIPLRVFAVPVGGLLRSIAAWLAFDPQSGWRHYLREQYADQTFKGLYHWNLFDASILLPYFAVMILLSFYGIHRYTMAYQYFKYRKNYDPNPPRHFDELPQVTIQLPIFNEQFVIDRLIEAVCAMEYPREKLEIQVLDDSTDETLRGGLRPSSSATPRSATPSSTFIAPIATASRPEPSTPASKWPKASSSPSSTPTSFPRPTGS